MQRDTDLTLCQAFEGFRIEDHVLAEPVDTALLDQLRFIRVPPIDKKLDFPSKLKCSLSEKGENVAVKNYLAVSYCWGSFDATKTTKEHIFDVEIEDRGQIRHPRCPVEVLRTAILYAVKHKITIVWIDQECIDQSNPADVEDHLQCMHLIFQQAQHVIGLLSFEVSTMSQYLALGYLGFGDDILSGSERNKYDTEFADYTVRLVKSLSKDQWFSRSWVYQEKHSSMNTINLLLPISRGVREVLRTQKENFDNLFTDTDYDEYMEIKLSTLVHMPFAWAVVVHEAPEDKIDSGKLKELQNHIEMLHRAMSTISPIGHLPLHLMLKNYQSDKEPSDGINLSDGFMLAKFFKDIESCDNRFVRDRVAIFANVANLERRVKITNYRSYSVSLFFHLLENDCFPQILVQSARPTDWSRAFRSEDVSAQDLAFDLIKVTDLVKSSRMPVANDLLEHKAILNWLLNQDVSGIEWEEARERLLRIVDGKARSDDQLWANSTVQNMKCIAVVPATATISEIFEGIAYAERGSSESLDHDLGRSMVQYGVAARQLPAGVGVKFLSFFGQWRWKKAFIESHFDALNTTSYSFPFNRIALGGDLLGVCLP